MRNELTTGWASQFFAILENNRDLATELREASMSGALGRWTAALTRAVVEFFDAMKTPAAGKGHRCSILPVERHEYHALDVTEFRSAGQGWQFPAVVCELENATGDARIAYSLWKVLCVRADLRAAFFYRPEPEAAPALVAQLADEVVGALPIKDRIAVRGDTLVIIGSRSDAGTFPYGLLQFWRLSANTGHFDRFARQ